MITDPVPQNAMVIAGLARLASLAVGVVQGLGGLIMMGYAIWKDVPLPPAPSQ
jgi:hypothetical protein